MMARKEKLDKNAVTKSDEWKPHAKQVHLAHLLASPECKGTKDQLAEKAGVTRKTMWEWMKIPEYRKYVEDLTNQYCDMEYAEVRKAHIRRCKQGDISAIKLYHEIRGDIVDNKKIAITGKDGGPIETMNVNVDVTDNAALEARISELIAKRGTRT